jgi:hypothetical protein
MRRLLGQKRNLPGRSALADGTFARIIIIIGGGGGVIVISRSSQQPADCFRTRPKWLVAATVVRL